MAENKLADMSTEFAIQILKLTENIKGHILCQISLNEAERVLEQISAKRNMLIAVLILFPNCKSP